MMELKYKPITTTISGTSINITAIKTNEETELIYPQEESTAAI